MKVSNFKLKIGLDNKRGLQIIFLFLPYFSIAQVSSEVILFDQSTNPAGILREVPLAEPKLEGSAYLEEEWRHADLTLRNGKVLKGVLLRYDLLNEILELKTKTFSTSVGIDYFTHIKIYPNPFDNSVYDSYESMINYDQSKEGIIKIVYQDDVLTIVEKHSVKIKEPTYIPTHHVGNRNMEILKEYSYYAIEDGKLVAFKKSKVSLSQVFNIDKKELKDFIRSEKLDINNYNHLARIIKTLYL